ncbi:glycosyltransferase family 4 protein [Cryobacterium roopkundense]|uniref:Glycosyltransferase involved in cell wall biosynthesis n=1 Tax=Cryobacterium roopkundense TaxID=1001240 RepID=A0A7W9E481_9MICO|nr:glycosyltransferase family 4 protein [Cryobacterium roopkundense]MBB5642397.1 glycosyltransferase involved in cell wall biosynthesis [Cryobacterium roopkundense]
MKIAIVHSYYSSRQPSGENVVVDAQASALSEWGFDVRVVAARTDELETSRAYKLSTAVTVATGRGPSPVRELENFAPDLVHVHNLFPNWGTAWLNRWHGPLVATVHNFRPVCAAGTLFRDGAECTLCPATNTFAAVKHACYRGSKVATIPLAIRSRNGVAGDPLLSRADAVILLTERARGLYEGFGLPAEKISLIPNFVDDVGFTRSTPGTDWVYIGRLTEEKGIANLIKHWPETHTLRIYGDGPLREHVESEAQARGNVTYLGRLEHDAVAGVLAGARGLVFPSEWAEGGIPLSYVEALAAGRMVVAMAGSSGADDLEAAGAGSIFRDWAGLAAALDEACAHSEVFARRARSHYEENFRRETFLQRTDDLYRRLVAHSRAGATHA